MTNYRSRSRPSPCVSAIGSPPWIQQLPPQPRPVPQPLPPLQQRSRPLNQQHNRSSSQNLNPKQNSPVSNGRGVLFWIEAIGFPTPLQALSRDGFLQRGIRPNGLQHLRQILIFGNIRQPLKSIPFIKISSEKCCLFRAILGYTRKTKDQSPGQLETIR